jgi:hypothetical protein
MHLNREHAIECLINLVNSECPLESVSLWISVICHWHEVFIVEYCWRSQNRTQTGHHSTLVCFSYQWDPTEVTHCILWLHSRWIETKLYRIKHFIKFRMRSSLLTSNAVWTFQEIRWATKERQHSERHFRPTPHFTPSNGTTILPLLLDSTGTRVVSLSHWHQYSFNIGLKRNTTLKNMPLPLNDISSCLKGSEAEETIEIVRKIERSLARNQSPTPQFQVRISREFSTYHMKGIRWYRCWKNQSICILGNEFCSTATLMFHSHQDNEKKFRNCCLRSRALEEKWQTTWARLSLKMLKLKITSWPVFTSQWICVIVTQWLQHWWRSASSIWTRTQKADDNCCEDTRASLW